jgi:hypothetical protein
MKRLVRILPAPLALPFSHKFHLNLPMPAMDSTAESITSGSEAVAW